jgi:ABC-type uncharacterized transport system involved in gliding motility auxiliary subunit
MAVILVGFNFIISFLDLRWDATEEKLYTLSTGSNSILEDVAKKGDTVKFKFYFSKSMENVPFAYKLYGKKVEEFLNEYVKKSSGRIEIETMEPKPDTDVEEWAVKYGLAQAALPGGDKFYLGLVMICVDQEEVIPFFNMDREEFLEYDISRALVQVTTAKKDVVGVMSSLPVVGQAPMPYSMNQAQEPTEDWLFLKELKKTYTVRKIETDVTEIPADVSLLMVIHPKSFPDHAVYAIDQFVLRGGRLIVMVDPSSQADTSQGSHPYFARMSKKSDLPKLFKKWGIKYDSAMLAADIEHATPVNAGQEGVQEYPIWMSFKGENLDRKSPVTSQLENTLFIEAGILEKAEDTENEFIPLIKTGPKGVKVGMDKVMGSPASLRQSLDLSSGKELAIAGLVRGTFKSAFTEPPRKKEEPAGEGEDKEKEDEKAKAQREKEYEKLKEKHISQAQASSTIFVIADTDFIYDSYCVKAMNFFGAQLLQPLNDNLACISNTVDFLAGSEDLISVRSRGKFTRTFTYVEELEKNAQAKWQEEEKALSQKLEAVQKRINDLQNQKKGGERLILNEAQRREIEKAREDKIATMKQRRQIRKLLRQDIENLGSKIKFVNIAVMPFIIAVIGVYIYINQNRKRGIK